MKVLTMSPLILALVAISQFGVNGQSAELPEKSLSALLNIEFKVYNRNHPQGSNFTLITPLLLLKTKFTSRENCVFVTHGWIENFTSDSVQTIVKGYLKTTNWNAIGVDWSKDAKSLYPKSAVFATKKIGRLLGDMVTRLSKIGICPLKKTHLIGHSLGAHVVGNAGSTVFRNLKDKVARVTGLDPAGPLFDFLPEKSDSRLDASDGDFVDALHTNKYVFGSGHASGHVDFYANGGGPHQPGCNPFKNVFCSHRRSYALYAESVENPKAFEGLQCSSHIKYMTGFCKGNKKIFMGPNTPVDARGTYYFNTRSSPPYSPNGENLEETMPAIEYDYEHDSYKVQPEDKAAFE